jgi:hypothetical protein
MAISLTSLTPVKNELDVSVASDVSFTIVSNSADLDITTVKFLINNVEVQPSAYYGIDETTIDVSFFSKRRIKYKTRSYGQNDVRYGQRDIFPSIFQYGHRYVCTIEVQDTNGLSFTENFSFIIEEGIFYSESNTSSFYYPQTQAVANYTPEWAKARYDKYSNMQQFVNAPGKFLQEIEDSLFKQTSSYYVQTSDLNNLATLHKVELGGDFEFQTTVLDDGTRLQIPPEIEAIKDITKYEPMAEFRNDVKSFFYENLPSRIDETKAVITDMIVQAKTAGTDALVKLDKPLEREGYISIRIEDATRFTQIKNNSFTFVFCRITGESRERKKQIEDLVIIDNDTYFTSKLWRNIDTIQFINLPKDSGLNYTIDHARPLGSFVADSFSFVTATDEDKSTFWKTKTSTYGTVLQQWVLLEVDPENIISSLGQKDLVSEMELLDIDGVTNLELLDIDADIFSNFMYGIDQDYFYIFDKREEYPNVIKQLPETNGVADFVINLDGDELGRGDTIKTVTLSGLQKVIGKEIASYRLSITRPNGTIEYILTDGTLTTDKGEASNRADQKELQFQTNIFSYDLDILGDYVFKLETVFRDGTTSIDSKISRLQKKVALSKYKLERIFGNATIERMFIDFDQQVKVLDSNSELHTLRFVRDNVLIDYNNSLLYFNEDYEEVTV